MIDLTLNSIMIPAIAGYTPPFGTKKASGGLSTQEVNDNIIAGFARQRPVIVSESTSTSEIQYNATLVINTAGITLTLGAGAYAGCEVKVIANAAATISYSGQSITAIANRLYRYIWLGTIWMCDNIIDIEPGRQFAQGQYSLNMQNSDIINANAIYMGDFADAVSEGINYKRSNGNFDSFKIMDGIPKIDLNVVPQSGSSDGSVIIPTYQHTVHTNTADTYSETYKLGPLLITAIKKIVEVNIDRQSGSIWWTQINGIPYPVAYTNVPTVSVFSCSQNSNAWVWGADAGTRTSTPALYIGRGTAIEAKLKINVIAIGI